MALQSTNVGINYQQRVSACIMMCANFDISLAVIFSSLGEEKIHAIQFEGKKSDIDDLIITTEEENNIFMQMKRKLSFEMHTGSELYKVLRQFVSRFCKNDKRDMRYILVTRSESSRKITIILKRILDAIRYAGDDNIAEFSKEEEKILCEIKKMISSILIEESISSFNEKKIIEFLKKTYVEILDIEEGEIYEKIVLLLLDSKVNRNAKILWNVLVADSLQHASQRRLVLTKELKKQLLPYCNELKEFSPLKDIIVEATGNIDVHKDYILVENNKELHSILELPADKMESLLLIELYRFEGGRKKENIRYWVPDQMTFAQDIKCKLLYRCSTRDRMIDYINSERLDEDTIIYFPTMAPNELTEQEDMYQKLLENRINSKEVRRCINCGRIIGEKSAVVIEIDNEEITGDAGIVHEKCIQPVDRVLGIVCLEGDFVNQSVNKLDVYLWCKLMVGGQGCWNNIGMLTDRCFNFFIDTKDVFRKGNYCVRMLLENGEHRYVKDRGLVHRLNYNDAVAYVTYLNRIYKRAIIENNPMCYSSETDTYGQYNDLVKQLGIKEEYITCVSAECIRYNDNIARKYNECERYYTPIIYLLVDGRPLAVEGVVPFITNPLDIDRYVNNWCLSGYIIEDYDVEVVENDNDFILLLAGVFGNDELPIVNCLFTKNKELVQGVIIQDMSLLGIPRNFCEGMQVDYDFV